MAVATGTMTVRTSASLAAVAPTVFASSVGSSLHMNASGSSLSFPRRHTSSLKWSSPEIRRRCGPWEAMVPHGRRCSLAVHKHVWSIGACRSFASSAAPEDPYKVLGVPRSASQDEIKAAYRKQAMKSHPDRQPDGKREEAQRRFAEIASAYEVLSDPDKRRQFDSGSTASSGFGMRPPGGFPGGFPGGGFSAGGFPGGHQAHSQESAEKLFRDVFGGRLEDVLSQMFNQEMQPRMLQPGAEVKVSGNLPAVLQACRDCGIDSTNDAARRRSLGKIGTVVKIDPSDQTVKIKVNQVGDVWFGLQAVHAAGKKGMGGDPLQNFGGAFNDAFRSFGGGFGSPGGFGGGGGSATSVRQQIMQRPDGTRVIKITRTTQMPDGSFREDVTETPMH